MDTSCTTEQEGIAQLLNNENLRVPYLHPPNHESVHSNLSYSQSIILFIKMHLYSTIHMFYLYILMKTIFFYLWFRFASLLDTCHGSHRLCVRLVNVLQVVIMRSLVLNITAHTHLVRNTTQGACYHTWRHVRRKIHQKVYIFNSIITILILRQCFILCKVLEM